MAEQTENTENKATSKAAKSDVDNFCPHKIAIDVYNGLYGFYANEQRRLLANRKYTSKQISEIMDIVETIGR